MTRPYPKVTVSITGDKPEVKEDFQDEEFKSNITNVEEFQNLLDIEGDVIKPKTPILGLGFSVIVIFYNARWKPKKGHNLAKWCRKCKATKPKIARIK